VSGRQGGIGPADRVATPNAVPNTTNKNPSMIFAFMCLSSAAVAAMGTDFKRKSALQFAQKNLRAGHIPFRGPRCQARSFYFGMQTVSGRQGGVGSPPLNPFAAPSAVPNTTNKNPSMIFVFTVPSPVPQ